MSDSNKNTVSVEEFYIRTRVGALIGELNQITIMTDDAEILAWIKNREFELVGVTNTKLKRIQEKISKK